MRLNLWKLRTSYCTVQWVRFFAFCRVLLDEHSSSVENINTNTYPTHGIPSSLFDFLQIFATLFCEIFIITVLFQWNNNVDCSSSVKRVLILKKKSTQMRNNVFIFLPISFWPWGMSSRIVSWIRYHFTFRLLSNFGWNISSKKQKPARRLHAIAASNFNITCRFHIKCYAAL